MSPDQPGRERQEIPFGPRRRENVPHRHVHLRENLRNLVHEGDVDVALRVLDYFGGFGHPDRGGAKHSALRDRAIERGNAFKHLWGLSCHDLGDLVDRVLAVARIDPFGAVGQEEIATADEAGRGFEDRTADVLGYPGIDSAFEHHDRCRAPRPAFGEQRSHRVRGSPDNRQIGPVVLVDWGRHGDDVEICRRTLGNAVDKLQRGLAQHVPGNLVGPVEPGAQLRDPACGHVEPCREIGPGQRNRQRKPDIAQADDVYRCLRRRHARSDPVIVANGAPVERGSIAIPRRGSTVDLGTGGIRACRQRWSKPQKLADRQVYLAHVEDGARPN